MNINNSIKATLLTLAIIFPLFCAAQIEATGLHFKAEVMTILNIILLITSLICIREFFWPGDTDNTPFHVINILMIITFYSVGLYFLISNKQEYVGFERLSPMGCIIKFFFTFDIDSLKQWVLIFGAVINVCYIVRKARSII